MSERIDGNNFSPRERLMEAIERTMDRYPLMTVRKELSGSPAVGQVSFIRQIHRNTRTRLGDDVQESIGAYQAQVLAYLLEQNFDAIFSEGHLQSTMTRGERAEIDRILGRTEADRVYIDEESEKANEQVRYIFQNFNVHDVTSQQIQVLRDWGADQVYAVIRDKPVIGSDNVMELLPQTQMSDHGTFFARERGAAKQVREYLDQHPGSKVALVFGASHSFTFDFRRDLPLSGWFFKQFGERKKKDRPELSEIHFPRAEYVTLSLLHGSPIAARANIHAGEVRRKKRRIDKRTPRAQKSVARRLFEESD